MFDPKVYHVFHNTLLYHDIRNNPNYFRIYKSPSRNKSAPHVHDVYQITYVTRDACIHMISGKEYVQHAGEFLIVPPFFPHAIDSSKSHDFEFVSCDFADGFLSNAAFGDDLFNLVYLRPIISGSAQLDPILRFDLETTRRIEQIFFNLLVEYQNFEKPSQDFIRINLVKLLTLILNHVHSAGAQEDVLYHKYRTALQNAMEFIDANFTKNISLAQVCHIALMSTASFSYIFKRLTGKTFMDYLTHLRIKHACKLLESTSLPLSALGEQCGFYDAPHFLRTFKRLMNMTPAQYRKLREEHPF